MLKATLLIQAMEKQPSLWDPSNEDYHKNCLKDDTWNKVCQEIYSGWDTFSKAEKHEKKIDAKKRWNNIRDYYKKDLNSQNINKYKKYQFSGLLEFLKPVLLRKRPRESSSSDDDEGEEEEETLKKPPIPSSSTTATNTTSKPKQIEPKKMERNTFQHSIFSSVLDREEDSDFLFLKSLLPDMKKLTDEQKFDFKLGIMHLYRSITRPEATRTRTESVEDQKDYSLFVIDPLSKEDD